MNIIVCVKRTPDARSSPSSSAPGASMDLMGRTHFLGPYDELAVVAALRARRSAGRGKVTAVSFGEAAAAEPLRACLAMGADAAVLLRGTATIDGLVTARALASEIEAADAPLVFTGLRSVDGHEQIGPMLATLLDRPCVTSVREFEVQDGAATCRRDVDGGIQIVEVDFPAVLTVTKGHFKPIAVSVKDIVGAKDKPLLEKDVPSGSPRLIVERVEAVANRRKQRVVGEGATAVAQLVRHLHVDRRIL